MGRHKLPEGTVTEVVTIRLHPETIRGLEQMCKIYELRNITRAIQEIIKESEYVLKHRNPKCFLES